MIATTSLQRHAPMVGVASALFVIGMGLASQCDKALETKIDAVKTRMDGIDARLKLAEQDVRRK